MESIWDQVLSDKPEEKYKTINKEKVDEITRNNTSHCYLDLPLSEIKKRDIAFQIYSEYVDDTFWICSNDEMYDQIKSDDPESVVYHINEIIRICNLKPNSDELKRIHKVKKDFDNSNVLAIKKKKC